MDLQLANELCLEYYSQGKTLGLEEERLELLRVFRDQINIIQERAMQPPEMSPTTMPQAIPSAPPVSDMIPNVPGIQQ